MTSLVPIDNAGLTIKLAHLSRCLDQTEKIPPLDWIGLDASHCF